MCIWTAVNHGYLSNKRSFGLADGALPELGLRGGPILRSKKKSPWSQTVYLCFKVSKIAFGFYVYLIFQPKENSVLDMGLVTIKNWKFFLRTNVEKAHTILLLTIFLNSGEWWSVRCARAQNCIEIPLKSKVEAKLKKVAANRWRSSNRPLYDCSLCFSHGSQILISREWSKGKWLKSRRR